MTYSAFTLCTVVNGTMLTRGKSVTERSGPTFTLQGTNRAGKIAISRDSLTIPILIANMDSGGPAPSRTCVCINENRIITCTRGSNMATKFSPLVFYSFLSETAACSDATFARRRGWHACVQVASVWNNSIHTA